MVSSVYHDPPILTLQHLLMRYFHDRILFALPSVHNSANNLDEKLLNLLNATIVALNVLTKYPINELNCGKMIMP